MTRRRNPPPRGPLKPLRAAKEKEIDNDLRLARATRKAEAIQKQQLRRQQWDTGYGDDGDEGDEHEDWGAVRDADAETDESGADSPDDEEDDKHS